ncbi:hypothetical protein M3225_28050 [Priestia aryabhattai]|uniref:hypothetical protein n=1 Tax=Priestia aryabhattai TaxID=412384 RepID=UPI0020415DE8|nr:hypothetical protein [Priestia aryabhattai]MCM3774239.1 hypothetical protein [Priestia aryabhattai]
MFKKRLVWSKKSIWYAIAILVIIPIVVNALMFIPVGKAVSTNSVWVGFFGSYIGSILSGLFTLLGVMMTINDLKNRESEDKLPKQLMAIDDLLMFIGQQNRIFLQGVREQLGAGHVNARLDYTLEGPDNSEGLLKLASDVNLNTYKTVRRLYDSFSSFRRPNLGGATILTESDIIGIYKECIDGLKVEKQKIENKIGN